MPKLHAMPAVLPVDVLSGLTSPLAGHTLSLTDEAATPVFDVAFAQVARVLGVWSVQVQLSGDLGAGKTTLLRVILCGLGHTGHVRSPTYTLVGPYNVAGTMGTQRAYHFDLYRSADPEKWTDAGFRDCSAESALCLIEWPEKVQALLGTPDLYIVLSIGVVHETYEDGVEHVPRIACLSARTQTGLQLLQSLQHLFPC